jgi:RNA polymerase sigma-70 factor (ECF subfamily)
MPVSSSEKVQGSLDAVVAQAPRGAAASPSDAEVLRRLRAGDEETFAALVDAHHGTMVRLALVFVRTRAAAEEVAQDAWVGVLKGLATFEERSSLKTWILRILTNRAKSRGVRDGRSVPFSSIGDADEEAEPAVDPERFKPNDMWAEPPRPWADDTPERLLMRREALALVEKTIDELPPQQRAVILLRDIEGESTADVCNVLEISETNQRVLLHRARMRVRRALEQYLDEEP